VLLGNGKGARLKRQLAKLSLFFIFLFLSKFSSIPHTFIFCPKDAYMFLSCQELVSLSVYIFGGGPGRSIRPVDCAALRGLFGFIVLTRVSQRYHLSSLSVFFYSCLGSPSIFFPSEALSRLFHLPLHFLCYAGPPGCLLSRYRRSEVTWEDTTGPTTSLSLILYADTID
jgi:hypothetical protein